MNKAEKLATQEWAANQTRCAICHWPESDPRRRLHVHHICGGSARSAGHDPRNYLRLCQRDHDIFHSGSVVGKFPPLYKGTLLWAKQDSDPKNYDPRYLASLRRKQHLGYEPIPPDEWYLRERKINGTRARTP